MLPSVALLSLLVADLAAPTAPKTIVNGNAVTECGFPTVVALDNVSCTGTLVHPRVISTAQHCGEPQRALFGAGGDAGFAWQAGVVGCVRQGSEDAMLCLLDTEIPLPVTPVAFGCELDELLAVGQTVVMAGFGSPQFGQPGQVKEWATQEITAVETQRVIVGRPGQAPSPCSGDSGGPGFVQAADGSWRTFGTVFRGTTGVPCNSAADFQRVDRVVPHFERITEIDITPCFDGQTGAWDPGPECGGFSAAGPTLEADWSNWCEGGPTSAPSTSCGPAFVPDAGAAQGGSCEDACGEQSADGCWCDAQCVQQGDCCPDRDAVCDLPADGYVDTDGEREPAADSEDAQGCSVGSNRNAGLALLPLLLLVGRIRRKFA